MKLFDNKATYWRWIGRAECYRTIATAYDHSPFMRAHFRQMMRDAAKWALLYRRFAP